MELIYITIISYLSDAAKALIKQKESKRNTTMKMLLVMPKKKNKKEMQRLLSLMPTKRK